MTNIHDAGLTIAGLEETTEPVEERNGLDLTADPAAFMSGNMPKVLAEFDRAESPAQVQFITSMVGAALQLAAQQAGERIQLAAMQAQQEEQQRLRTLGVDPNAVHLNRAQRRSLR